MEGLTDGEALARVALHYGLISDTHELTQKIVCPIHEDVNPSMMVNLDRGTYHCFGCEAHGDAQKLAVTLERKYHGANDVQALMSYYRILRTTECDPIRIPPRSRSKAISRQLYVQAYDYYHGLSRVPWTRSQALSGDMLNGLRYMEERGFTAEFLEEVDARWAYTRDYPLVFPMKDNGKFKGWVSRTFDPELSKRRKYLYNKGFSRATTLVGDYQQAPFVYVVEGNMDRFKLMQLGLPNVVAILGWKMSAQQISKLKAQGVTKVIAATDNDDAGRKGWRWLCQNFETTRWAYLKGIKDPGDFTPDNFQKMYERTMQKFEERKS